MLEALIEGTTDPEVLAELARGRLRSKIPALKEALEGSFFSHHALMASRILSHIDYLDETIEELSVEIERALVPFSDKVELLDTIPGVNRRVAETIIAEIGATMDQFPTHNHLASWAGMRPGNDESPGKRRSDRTRKGSKWLRSAFIGAAHAAAKTKGSYLSARYARIKGRRAPKKAAVAVGHSILVICYHVLGGGEPYQELGEKTTLTGDARRRRTGSDWFVNWSDSGTGSCSKRYLSPHRRSPLERIFTPAASFFAREEDLRARR